LINIHNGKTVINWLDGVNFYLYKYKLSISQKTIMKPHRPDSAKSGRTRLTVDSELTQSKFSETYSSGVSKIVDRNIDFHKYVA
jgi:hypothetical protein